MYTWPRLWLSSLQRGPQGQDRPGPHRGQPHVTRSHLHQQWTDHILSRAKQKELNLHRKHELGMTYGASLGMIFLFFLWEFLLGHYFGILLSCGQSCMQVFVHTCSVYFSTQLSCNITLSFTMFMYNYGTSVSFWYNMYVCVHILRFSTCIWMCSWLLLTCVRVFMSLLISQHLCVYACVYIYIYMCILYIYMYICMLCVCVYIEFSPLVLW